jgi:catechol 2,3-dioxygenase-like lactoylglutathione lyase family enzyme
MVGTLNFVIVHVKDMAAARAFYTEKLEYAVVDETPGFIQLDAGNGATLSLQLDDQAAPTTSVELWWEVADADATYALLTGRHVEVAEEPKDMPFGRVFSLKDPEGNLVNYFQLRQG